MKISTLYDLTADLRGPGSEAGMFVAKARQVLAAAQGCCGNPDAYQADVDGLRQTLLRGRFTDDDVGDFVRVVKAMTHNARSMKTRSPHRGDERNEAFMVLSLMEECLADLQRLAGAALRKSGPRYGTEQGEGWVFLGAVPPCLDDPFPVAGWHDLWACQQPNGGLVLSQRYGHAPSEQIYRQEHPQRWLEMFKAGGDKMLDGDFIVTRNHRWMDAIRLAMKSGLVPTSDKELEADLRMPARY